jgi:hypothetical protein
MRTRIHARTVEAAESSHIDANTYAEYAFLSGTADKQLVVRGGWLLSSRSAGSSSHSLERRRSQRQSRQGS